MNLRTISAVGAAGVLALSLTACGSSSSESSPLPSSSTLTKAEWVKQANAICKDLNDRTNGIEPQSEAELASALVALGKIADEDVPKFAALKPPAEISADVATLVGYFNDKIAAIKSASEKASAGDTAGAMQVMTDNENVTKQAETLSTKLGLTECRN